MEMNDFVVVFGAMVTAMVAAFVFIDYATNKLSKSSYCPEKVCSCRACFE